MSKAKSTFQISPKRVAQYTTGSVQEEDVTAFRKGVIEYSKAEKHRERDQGETPRWHDIFFSSVEEFRSITSKLDESEKLQKCCSA